MPPLLFLLSVSGTTGKSTVLLKPGDLPPAVGVLLGQILGAQKGVTIPVGTVQWNDDGARQVHARLKAVICGSFQI